MALFFFIVVGIGFVLTFFAREKPRPEQPKDDEQFYVVDEKDVAEFVRMARKAGGEVFEVRPLNVKEVNHDPRG